MYGFWLHLKFDVCFIHLFSLFFTFMKINKDNVKKILIIQPRGLGDIVLSTVISKNCRKDFPKATIDYVVQFPLNAALEKLPFINEIITYYRKSIKSGLGLILRVRKNNYNLVIDLFSNPRTALVTFLSGAKYRAGKPASGRNYAYNIEREAHDKNAVHQVQRNLDFLRQLDISHESQELFFGLGDEDIQYAEEFFNNNFNDGDFVAGISPSGRWPARKCDPVKLAEIGDAIVDRFGAKILLIWGPGEEEETKEISGLMKNKTYITSPTDIRQMGAFVAKCSMLVANNSGPMHIATAVKTPVISLEGPTNPRIQGPFGPANESIRLEELECIGCHRVECPKNHECFLDLPIKRIMDKIEILIKKNNLLAEG